MSRRTFARVGCVICGAAPVHAALRIAVIDTAEIVPSYAAVWCDFFESEGHVCVAYPSSGPTDPLDSFRIVVDLSESWPDPAGMLPELMQRGGGLILWGSAPNALGIDSDPTVRAMIGANAEGADFDGLITVATDPILGNTPIGTLIVYCGDAGCRALYDTTGHPNAHVLALLRDGVGRIGLMRNEWGGGQSVFLVRPFGPDVSPDFIRRIIEALHRPIPATSSYSLLCLFLVLSIAATLLFRRSRSRFVYAVLTFLAVSSIRGAAFAQEISSQANDAATELVYSNEVFHTTRNTMANIEWRIAEART